MEKKEDDTPEWFEPTLGLDVRSYIAAEDMLGTHHLARYEWAKEVLAEFSPARVLDIACGTGYGSFILASHLSDADVVGADYDSRAIELARQKYQRPNLSYTQGNIVTWEREGQPEGQSLGGYDAIVSFDTIEHLLHREIALIRLTQHLSKDGILLLSTPCGHEHTRLNPGWEHHKIEYSHRDLRNLLKRFFQMVLVPEEAYFPHGDYWRSVINRDRLRYLNKSNPIVCRNPIA